MLYKALVYHRAIILSQTYSLSPD